ncbi:hypothetical protein ACO0LM_11945 [Undibacterium sp. Di26W]|uniref:hypothetical protein n=1 Tax=Undibacterium sp. Di26W TaxID=3413035 RepID=UPI003BF2620E
MMAQSNQLKLWLNAASAVERRNLAKEAGTTVGTLQQIAGAYRNDGVAQIRSGLAGKIANAAALLRKKNKELPEILRTDLSPECRGCEFAQKCLGQRAVASEFNAIEDDVSDLC